jgi:hypothetical protein
MAKNVHLKVRKGEVDAHVNWDDNDGGHFNAKPGSKVVWDGKYKKGDVVKGDFVVTFFDVSNDLKAGWPFDGTEPADLKLIVKGDGSVTPGMVLKNSDALWKYEVAVTGTEAVVPLDPMIIVRDSNPLQDAAALLIAFALGALASVVAQRTMRRKDR